MAGDALTSGGSPEGWVAAGRPPGAQDARRSAVENHGKRSRARLRIGTKENAARDLSTIAGGALDNGPLGLAARPDYCAQNMPGGVQSPISGLQQFRPGAQVVEPQGVPGEGVEPQQ